VIATDFRSPASGRARQQRRQDVVSASEGRRRSKNDCGSSSRRVLFKNNVSVYCFDAGPPVQARNWTAAVSDGSGPPGRRSISRDNPAVRSDGHPHETIVRPPTSLSHHDNRRRRRPATSELDERPRVDRQQLTSPQRRPDKHLADKNVTQHSSNAVVGNFEVR